MKKWFYCFFCIISCAFLTSCSLFNKTPKVDYYLVVFESNGGLTIPSQKIKPGENVIEPDKPTRNNYEFVGWYLDGDIFNFSMPVTRDLTLEAKWHYSPNQVIVYDKMVKVTFLINSYDEPYYIETINSGSLIGLPPIPLRSGFIFKGWEYNNVPFDFENPINEDITLLAKWGRITGDKQFTVYFDSNGGTSVDSQIITQGSRVIYPVPPTKNGYTFTGWTLDGETYNFDAPVNDNIVLIANWIKNGSSSSYKNNVINKYTVAFETNGGTKISNQTVYAGNKVIKPTNPIKSGYTFKGWNYHGSVYNFNSLVNSNMTLYAIWEKKEEVSTVKKYTVTFDSLGGSSVPSQAVYENALVKVPTNPTKSGYVFAGWTYNGSDYDFNTKVKKSMVLKAKWSAGTTSAATYYNVSFNSLGGSTVEKQIVKSGYYATEPANPIYDGYTFSHWSLNGSRYNFNTAVKENITLVAVWVKSEPKRYTVTFDTNGGSTVGSQTVESGSKVATPNNPTKSGYTFIGWTLNGSLYDFNTIINESITLYALWEKNKANYYNVSFDTNGGTSFNTISVESGHTVPRPAINPQKQGYTFIEWQLDNTSFDFNNYKVYKDIKLVAKWEQNATYTVTFVYGGNLQNKYKVVESGKTVSKPDNPIRENYTFVEWQLNGQKFDFENTSIYTNIILTAKWQENGTGQNNSTYYTVTFNSNGGSSVPSQTVTEGGVATKPANPTRSGYTFVSWQYNGNDFNFNSKLYTNITLVAKWK